jgi:hypothetical protein
LGVRARQSVQSLFLDNAHQGMENVFMNAVRGVEHAAD